MFAETKLKGAFIIEPEKLEDERGFFARIWCEREFAAHGLNPRVVQCSISFNKRRGTLRGMHYQIGPLAEAKLVRCTMGAIDDVMIDLRQGSPTFKQYVQVEMDSENHRMVFVPEGFAQGFLTLKDNTEVFYQMSEFYSPQSARGVRWNDPAFGIRWPFDPIVILKRDASYPDFKPRAGDLTE